MLSKGDVGAQNGTHDADVFAFLEGFGYHGFFFSPHGLRPLQEFDPEIHHDPGSARF